MKPITSEVTVIPSWAPERLNDRRRSAAAVARARRLPACGVELDPIAVDGDERELDRDEEPGGEDEQEYGDEADRGVDGGIDLEPSGWRLRALRLQSTSHR